MDFQERSKLVRRISNGKLYTTIVHNNRDVETVFCDPDLAIVAKSDFIYDQTFAQCEEDPNIFTIEESHEQLINEGIWTLELEQEWQSTDKIIKGLKDRLKNLQFKKLEQETVRQTIVWYKKRKEELYNIKNQYWTYTSEYLADIARKRFLVENLVEFEIDIKMTPTLLSKLVKLYYLDSYINENQIRVLARTDPWRLYWTASKDTGTQLFGHACVQMTDLQYALVTWSKVYDFAFDSMSRPSDDIIEDDDKFDIWYEEECDRLKKELRQNKVDKTVNRRGRQGYGMQEIFIPSDREGAKEVYAMNDLEGRMRIKQRQNYIKKKGRARDLDLPDVKRDIQMESNKMAMQSAQSKGAR